MLTQTYTHAYISLLYTQLPSDEEVIKKKNNIQNKRKEHVKFDFQPKQREKVLCIKCCLQLIFHRLHY